MYIHDLSPFAIRFSESFGIRWYGLAYVAGFLIGHALISWFARKKIIALKPEQVDDFVLWVALGTVLGGRIGYAVMYDPALLTQFSSAPPFWDLFALWEGGMASHGGLIGVAIACLLYARRANLPALHLCDLVTLGGAIGIFFGRLANFVNGELYGRASSEHFPLAVKFPQELLTYAAFEPHKLLPYAGVVERLGVTPAAWEQAIQENNRPLLGFYAEKIVSEIQSGNGIITALAGEFLTPRYPSQLFEAALEGLLLFVILFFLWRVPRKAGIISGLFLSLYGIVRIIGEQFRLPDATIGYEMFGLTRGQILSIPTVLFGIAWVVYAASRNNTANTGTTGGYYGGWGKK